MIKIIKSFIFFFIFIAISGCSFDKKTGVWNSEEKIKKKATEIFEESKKVKIKIFSKVNNFDKEILATTKVNLTKPKKNLSWSTPELNNQNFLGNIYFSGLNDRFLKKKVGKNKFSTTSTSKHVSAPLVYDNSIIIANDSGRIYSVNTNGKINWKTFIYKKKFKKIYKNLSFVIYKNKIYISDNIGFIYCVNFENGEILWKKNFGIPFKSNIKIYNDKIFVINQDDKVYCIDLTGSKIWDLQSVTSFIKSEKKLKFGFSEDGFLLFINSSGDLVKIDTNQGRMFWSISTLDPLLSDGADFFKSSNIVVSDSDILFSNIHSTYSIDLSSGYVNWKVNIQSNNTPIVDGDNVFLISDNGYFINLNRKSGKVIWSTNVLKVLQKKKRLFGKKRIDLTSITGFIMGSNNVYISTLNGWLIECSANSGIVKNVKKIGDSIIAQPVISNGKIYILTGNLNLRIHGYS